MKTEDTGILQPFQQLEVQICRKGESIRNEVEIELKCKASFTSGDDGASAVGATIFVAVGLNVSGVARSTTTTTQIRRE